MWVKSSCSINLATFLIFGALSCLNRAEALNLNQTIQTQKRPQNFPSLPVIWVLGGPGAGKSHQCAMMADEFGLLHLSTGELLRKEVQDSPESLKDEDDQNWSLKSKISRIIQNGDLVPDDLVLQILIEAMKQGSANPNTTGFVLDGYPRTLKQAADFEKIVGPPTLILFFNRTDATLLEHVMRRKDERGRPDDTEETAKYRIALYHQLTEPVIQRYKDSVLTAQAESSDFVNIFRSYYSRIVEILGDFQKRRLTLQ